MFNLCSPVQRGEGRRFAAAPFLGWWWWLWWCGTSVATKQFEKQGQSGGHSAVYR